MQVSYCSCPPLPPIITAPAHHYRPCPPILSLTPILFRFFVVTSHVCSWFCFHRLPQINRPIFQQGHHLPDRLRARLRWRNRGIRLLSRAPQVWRQGRSHQLRRGLLHRSPGRQKDSAQGTDSHVKQKMVMRMCNDSTEVLDAGSSEVYHETWSHSICSLDWTRFTRVRRRLMVRTFPWKTLTGNRERSGVTWISAWRVLPPAPKSSAASRAPLTED